MKSLSDIRNKRVLYVGTKNSDYLRLTQEIRLLREQGNEVTVIASPEKSYLKRLIYVYRKLLSVDMDGYDLSFIGFAPQLVMPLFAWKLKKKPIVMDFFISMYDTLCFDRKKFSPKSLIGRFIKSIDKNTLKHADLTICDTKAHGKYFCEEFSYPQKRMRALYLEADTSIYYPRETAPHEDFTVLYFGSILPLQGVDVILEAMKLLENEEGLRFIVVGPLGSSRRTAENITDYYEWLSQEELAEKIASADLCLAGHFNSSIMKAKRTIPGKAYIYRAMEKPMILGDNPATHELYSESDEGIWFCPMGDPEALAKLIREIKEQRR